MSWKKYEGDALAVLFMQEDEHGDDDWRVVIGQVFQEGDGFIWRSGERWLPLDDEWLERVRPVQEEASSIFRGAKYCLPLLVGPLPDDTNTEEYTNLGWKIE